MRAFEQPFNVSANGSGYAYGPWFGSYRAYFGGEVSYTLGLANAAILFASWFMGAGRIETIAYACAGRLIEELARSEYERNVFGYIDKDYREVYVNGQFAIFRQDGRCIHYNTPIGNNPVIEYYEGDILMRSGELTA